MKWQTIKTVLMSAVGGALVWWIVLSAGWGWMTPGSAEKRAVEQAEVAVLNALVPICVAKFKQDGERDQKLEALKQSNSWEYNDFVMEQGWATMPGAEKPKTEIAQECASRILAMRNL